ncbi:MAG: protoporphyrinogen oxidase [Actinomycetota bacterium]
MKRIVVVGAGAAGLAAGYALKESLQGDKDIEFLVLEKNDKAGGQIRTVLEDGFILEGGPDCVISDKPTTFEFAKKLGIEDEMVNTRSASGGTYIIKKGQLIRMPEGVMMMIPTKFKPFIKTKLISWPGKIRAAMDVFIPRRKNLDEDEELSSFVRRRLGQEILDVLAEPLIGGIHASDPDTMSLASTFPRFLKMEKDDRSLILAMFKSKRKMAKTIKSSSRSSSSASEPGTKRWTMFVSFKNGMQTLTDALARALGRDVLKLKTEVQRIEKITIPGGKTAYKLQVKGIGDIEADAVVLTTLAFQTAALVEPFDSELAAPLSEINSVSSATVNLVYRTEDIPRELDANGFLVPRVEGRNLMASTWTSSKWPNRAPEGFVLLRAFVGGAFNQAIVDEDDATILKLIKSDLKDLMGITAEPSKTKIFRWKKSMPQYTMGYPERLAKIDERLAAHDGLFLAGASYGGVGVPDCMNNARKAALEALEYVKIGGKK